MNSSGGLDHYPVAARARQLRVAFVLWNGALGGAENFTAELAGSLRRRGVDASVVFVGNGDRLADRLAELDVPWRSLGLARGRNVVVHPWALAQLVAESGANCAIVAFSGYLAASLRAGGYRRPIAAVEHGALLQVDRLPLGRRLIRRIDRASGVWACDVEVAVSEYMLEKLREHRHSRRTLCIRNGIDLNRFSPQATDSREGQPFTIGYAGRLIPSKGVSDVIQAFASETMSSDSLLLIAGDGPERLVLEASARALGVADRTRFLGYVQDMPRFWRRCDVAVAPSAGWIESFCLAAVEAMASGRPVVASKAGALPETIQDGVTGALVDQGDHAGLARALEHYAADSSLRREHGANARRFCEDRYDLADTADAYIRLVASLTGKAYGVVGPGVSTASDS